MSYSFNMDSFVIAGSSIAFGILIGLFAKRALPFIALILIVPMAIGGGVYLAELVHLRNIGHGSSESWAGLAVPLLSAGSFIVLAPAALGIAGIRWLRSHKWNKLDRHG